MLTTDEGPSHPDGQLSLTMVSIKLPTFWTDSQSHLNPDEIPPILASCSHVFIREDSSKPPLSPLYRGPYLVLSKTPKYFVVQIGSESDSLSMDRLNPVISDQPVTSQQPLWRGRPPSAPAPLTPAPSAPALVVTSPVPLQRAKRMKKQDWFSSEHSPPLLTL